jgi:PAS domain S-box-containing protein
MPVKRQSARSKSSRTSKKQRRADYRKITASVGGTVRELIRADMKNKKRASHPPRKFSSNGAVRKNGATKRSASAPVFKIPKTELEAAIQRYVDLFEFAPIAYVSFDRVGRIEEINLAAVQLVGASRARLIGEPFALHVAKNDGPLFMNHLLRCRSSDSRVETELHLKKRNGEIIPAHLASSPITSSMRDGALLYQTAILDLTERKRAEEAIRQSEERYRTLFNLGPMAVYTIDTLGVIQEYNRQAVELWGREPALGDTDQRFCGSFKMFRPDGSFMPHDQCPMAEVASGKISVVRDGEVLIERSDGSHVTVLVNIQPLKNDRGEVTGAINCFYDITDRKRAEAAAMRLAALVRSSRDAVVAKDLNGIITDWNQGAQRIFGYKPKEIIGKSILTLIPREHQFEESDILRRIRRGESIDHFETIRRRRDGRLIEVSLTISPIRDLHGKIVGVSKIARDITERKISERRLTEQTRLLDLTNDAIFISDMRERITFWNRGAKELYGYSAEEAFGKVARELLCTEFPESIGTIRKRLVRDHRWSGELVHRRKDGSKVVVMSRWSLDHDERGKPMSILETNTDITARKGAEVALQRSKGALEHVVEQRTKELRVANAELENEIQRRKGLEGEILAVSDREQQRLGQELHDGLCQHLTAVAFMTRSIALRLRDHRVVDADDIEKVAELVNAAAVDTRNLSRALHRVDVDAAALVVALQDLVDREIWRTPCRLEMKPSFQINDDAAAAHFYRIAREAVINANKHAQARQIVVRLERVRKEIVLRVIDDGIGFQKDLKPQQGLGYHIMKYRAQLMGGRLEIDSPQTGGTRVSCYLPSHAPGSRKAPNADQMKGGMPKNSNSLIARELTLRHLARQRAANA